MNIQNLFQNKKILMAVVGVVFLILAAFLLLSGGPNTVNPNKDKTDENPRAGLDYALLYNQGELFGNIDEDEENLVLIQSDLALFAKTTMQEFADDKTRIGFTFKDGFKTSENTFTYSGYFYGVDDEIQVSVTRYESGVITLSLTNLKDQTNIDNSLNLNGPKNRLITKLPIESDNYSIRYLKSQDRVLVAYYRGYSLKDVDETVKILTEAYGGDFNESNFTFNINAVGIFTLDEVREYATSPENQF